MARRKTKKASWKVWAAAFGVLALIGIGSTAGSDSEPAPEPEISRAVVTAAPTAKPAPTTAPKPTATPYRIHGRDPETTIYVSKNGVIHFEKDCSGMKHCTEMTLEKADAAGYEYCSRCG